MPSPSAVLQATLEPHEIAAVTSSFNRPLACLQGLSDAIRRCGLDPVSMTRLDVNLEVMADIMGACERLLRTPIPLSYTRHTSRFLMLWLATLPFVLWPHIGWAVVPSTAVVSFLLFGIDEISVQLEEPFGILPLEAICDNIGRSADELLRSAPTLAAAVGASEAAAARERDEDAALARALERQLWSGGGGGGGSGDDNGGDNGGGGNGDKYAAGAALAAAAALYGVSRRGGSPASPAQSPVNFSHDLNEQQHQQHDEREHGSGTGPNAPSPQRRRRRRRSPPAANSSSGAAAAAAAGGGLPLPWYAKEMPPDALRAAAAAGAGGADGEGAGRADFSEYHLGRARGAGAVRHPPSPLATLEAGAGGAGGEEGGGGAGGAAAR